MFLSCWRFVEIYLWIFDFKIQYDENTIFRHFFCTLSKHKTFFDGARSAESAVATKEPKKAAGFEEATESWSKVGCFKSALVPMRRLQSESFRPVFCLKSRVFNWKLQTQMPDPKTYRQHFENKHPKATLPAELLDAPTTSSWTTLCSTNTNLSTSLLTLCSLIKSHHFHLL